MKKAKTQEKSREENKARDKAKQPVYEEPRVITYPGDKLLKELGPAQACRAFGCQVAP
jgi:hypothetical protein